MRPIRLAATGCCLVLLSGCGAGQATLSRQGGADALLHTGSGTVLESAEHGPELCLGGVEESLPPQCSGVPLVGWQWEAVSGAEFGMGTTWGSYSVTGTFDGKVLTLTEPAGEQVEPAGRAGAGGATGDEDPFATPC